MSSSIFSSASSFSSSVIGGMTIWYSFFGCGIEAKPDRRLFLSSACLRSSSLVLSCISTSFMLSSSRRGVAFGVKPKLCPSLDGVILILGVIPGPGLAKGVAIGFGVCISFLRGVTPEKSDG
uniref:Uncharacterized protein n=1 Tax=Zea mays TaxID=4577 RepID=C4IZD4_MAIZE|nr:unknown [Zea mays]